MTSAEQIAALLSETGEQDPRAAIRARARELISQYMALFGEPEMPLNIEALASLRGVRRSDEPPSYSPDAELVPEPDGAVIMRVNPDRPETRQRFSMGHEVTHTFFPGYDQKVQCRTDARHRDRQDPDDQLEALCDIGAAELLFPLPWFAKDAAVVTGALGLVELAEQYRASREATLRRYVETNDRDLAAVVLSWKLKPTQERTIGCLDQLHMFGDPAEEARASWKLRIDYVIPSPSFAQAGHFLPRDKSVELDGPFAVAARGACADADCRLELGAASGTYRIWAVPLYTPWEERGPGGELWIAAVLEPIAMTKPRRVVRAENRGLFD